MQPRTGNHDRGWADTGSQEKNSLLQLTRRKKNVRDISYTPGGKIPTRFQPEHFIRAVVYILFFPVVENAEEPQFEMDI